MLGNLQMLNTRGGGERRPKMQRVSEGSRNGWGKVLWQVCKTCRPWRGWATGALMGGSSHQISIPTMTSGPRQSHKSSGWAPPFVIILKFYRADSHQHAAKVEQQPIVLTMLPLITPQFLKVLCRSALALDLVGIGSCDTIVRWTHRMFHTLHSATCTGLQQSESDTTLEG